MMETFQTVSDILLRLAAAGFIGGLIGFERRAHHKAIGIAGMVLIAIGSTTFMLLAKHLSLTDPASISRTLQGLLSGIGFLGGAVIFKSGYDVRGVKAAAAVWITGCHRSSDRHLLLVAGRDRRCRHLRGHVRGG
jgi:putative Mg2+ transporter-C (MgtC) family protein